VQFKLTTPFVPISWGELVDKITILEIKNSMISTTDASRNIRTELKYLLEIVNFKNLPDEIQSLKTELKSVNLKLWNVEDQIREKENAGEFDQIFIELARSVYLLNDNRAKIKKSINLMLCSELVEEKSYKDYQTTGNLKNSL